MKTQTHEFSTFARRIAAIHTITYFLVGILVMNVFNYREMFASDNLNGFMKPTDSPWVALGPGLQLLRGLVFALVLWPFRQVFLSEKCGWCKLWFLFIGLSILSTFGPALGSIDGMIYTTVPVKQQLMFLPELILQSFLLSFTVSYWYRKPAKTLNVISVIFVVLILFMSIAGFMSLGK